MNEYRSPYPRPMYHATELPVLVKSEEQEQALGEGWSSTYIYQAYPKIKFGPNGEVRNVANPEEEAALGAGWSDTAPTLPDVAPVTLSPESVAVPAAGGAGSFTVTMTGQGVLNSWTVDPESAATWLHLVSPPAHTPQTANGTVSYTADENTNALRAGHFYINGKTFAVDQAGVTGATTSRKK